VLVNPLSAKDDDNDERPGKKDQGYVFRNHKGKTLQPISKDLTVPPHARPVTPSVHHPGQAGPQHHQVVVSAPEPSPQHGHGLHLPHTPKTHSPHHDGIQGTLEPAAKNTAAVELIRQKVAALYGQEPDVKEELQQSVAPAPPRSKHQLFMQNLSASGKPLAQIQNEWHAYYNGLPDHEKHEVWREFYQANARAAAPFAGVHVQPTAHTQTGAAQAQPTVAQTTLTDAAEGVAGLVASEPSAAAAPTTEAPKYAAVVRDHIPNPNFATKQAAKRDRRSKRQIHQQILHKVGMSASAQAKAKQHFQSLVFGIGTGLVVLLIFLFGFFNEMFIAPFIQPSRHVSATPIILTDDSVAASDTPQVIIPKINVQIPVVYGTGSIDENAIENSLEDGVVHYPTTSLPGQQGNAAFFGHSSNNILNKGKYKFAFALLHKLVPGDVFYLTYGKKVYSYHVFDKKVVAPSEVSVLNPVAGKVATATLITCDPPGTSNNRLIIWGEQISPDPATASAAPTPTTTQTTTPTELPSEGPTMWHRFWSWLF